MMPFSVMARLVRANPPTVWMARMKRAMTVILEQCAYA
jgi:hypothetical protein